MMDWLPAPQDFRGRLRLSLEPSADRLEKLAALSQHRLGFLETIQLDRALGQACPESPDGCLSISTTDHTGNTGNNCSTRSRHSIGYAPRSSCSRLLRARRLRPCH